MHSDPDEAGAADEQTPFDRMGGEQAVRALVERFYDLMDLEPDYAVLRGVHGPDLAQARERLFWFLCGWMGGPQHYIERMGHPRLRQRHMPFSIGLAERDQWLACMDQALRELGVDDGLRRRLNGAFFETADWMRNRANPM
ncbi:MAG: group II truncated hemoglobin [Betaproteobacteria bacterium]